MKTKGLASILLLALVVACSQSKQPPSTMMPPPSASPAEQEAAQTSVSLRQLAPSERRLVKKVDLDLRVSNTVAAQDQIAALTSELGGHIGSMTASNRDGILFYELTLRIPEARLDDAINRIKKLAARIDRESVNTEDVTDKFVDLNARLKTLEATEGELRTLLAESRQRQQKTEDVMTVYRELTAIRSNIEQIQGQVNVMENLTSLATIHVTLAPTDSPTQVVSSWKPSETIRQSFRALVTVLAGLVDLAIMLLIVVLPPAAILFAAVWMAIKTWKALRAKRRITTDV